MIQEDRCARAIAYLASTDESAAELKGEVARKDYLCRFTRANVFQRSEGSVEMRKAIAESSEEVQAAENERVLAIIEYEKVNTKRATEELIVEVWRSCNANRRHGNVV
jgi:hypothetical protein